MVMIFHELLNSVLRVFHSDWVLLPPLFRSKVKKNPASSLLNNGSWLLFVETEVRRPRGRVKSAPEEIDSLSLLPSAQNLCEVRMSSLDLFPDQLAYL